jgi:hypothetical protein
VKKEIINVYWIEREILRVRLEIRFELPRGMSALYAFTWLFEYFEKDKKWAGYFDKVSTDGKHYIRLENEEYLGAERRLF